MLFCFNINAASFILFAAVTQKSAFANIFVHRCIMYNIQCATYTLHIYMYVYAYYVSVPQIQIIICI